MENIITFLSECRFCVYEHKIQRQKELSACRMIALKNKDGRIICFTGLEQFSFPYTGKFPKITVRQKAELTYICNALNYIFAHNRVCRIADITSDMIINYFDAYCTTPKGQSTEVMLSQQSMDNCVRHVSAFFCNVAFTYQTKIQINELMVYEETKANRHSRKIVLRYVPIYKPKRPHSRDIKLLRDMPLAAARRLLELAWIHDPIIALGIALQLYAGLRPGCVVNMRQNNSPVSATQCIRFSRTGSAVSGIEIDLTQEYLLRSDGVTVGRIKKERVVNVYKPFIPYLLEAYHLHMELLSHATYDYNVGKAAEWLQQNGEAWEETLCGVYVTTHTAKILRSFLEKAIPVNPEFARFCNSISVVPTQAMYADFCSKYGKQLLQTRYHPYCADRWFWTGEKEELCGLIGKWYMEYSIYIPSDLEGYVSVAAGAATLEMNPVKLLEWLRMHEKYYICHDGCCLIDANKIEALRNQWENVQPIMALVKQKIDQLPVKARAGAKASVISWLEESNHDWILPSGTFPQQTDGVLYTLKPLAADHALDTVIHAYPAIAINQLVAVTHLQTKELKQKAADGIIEAIRDDNGNWYISINEYRRITVIQEQYIPLDEVVCACINGSDSKFNTGVHYIRDNLINYCNEHDWWGVNYAYCNELPIDGKNLALLLQERILIKS